MTRQLRVISIKRVGDTSQFQARVRMTVRGKHTFKNVQIGDTAFSCSIVHVGLDMTNDSNGYIGVVVGEMRKNNNFVVHEGETIEIGPSNQWFSIVA